MTITALAPLRTDRRALSSLLESIADAIDRDGFSRHEAAVQTLLQSTRALTPGAAATLGDQAAAAIARRHAFQVVSRVLTRCGDDATRRQAAERLPGAPPPAPVHTPRGPPHP